MKSLSVKVGIIFFIIGFTFGNIEAWGADWKPIFKHSGMFLYDAESITRPSKNIVSVWTKLLHSKEVVKEYGEEYKNLNYSLILHEFDCQERKMRLLSIHFYSEGGITTKYFDHDKPDWHSFGPEGAEEALYKVVCK